MFKVIKFITTFIFRFVSYMRSIKFIFSNNVVIRSTFHFALYHLQGKSNVVYLEGTCESSRISIDGEGNEILSEGGLILDSFISISGTNNKVLLRKGVKLRNSQIIVRGSGCLVEIGVDTTFGGVRIVNVGENNPIRIGEGCLFADSVEIWASDTHSIFDQSGCWINNERPISIGDKVWIGCRVIILKGVEIGNGSVVGMGTIVSKNIGPGIVVAGSPNKILRQNITWSLEYR